MLHLHPAHNDRYRELLRLVQKNCFVQNTIFELVKNFRSLSIGNVKNRTCGGRPRFRTRMLTVNFLLWPAPNETAEISSTRFRDSVLHHTKHPKKASSQVSIKNIKTVSVKTTRICWTSYFLNHALEMSCPITVSYIGSVFLMIVPLCIRSCQYSELSYLELKSQDKCNKMSEKWERISSMSCQPQWCGQCKCSDETGKVWPLTSPLKLRDSHRMLFYSRSELFLTLHAQSLLFWMKQFRIHG